MYFTSRVCQAEDGQGLYTRSVRQLQALGDNAESGKGCVPMDEEACHALLAAVAQPRLQRPHQSHHHRIHRLQVARIRRYRHPDLRPLRALPNSH